MPYLIPGRGATRFDSAGNYTGRFFSGVIPPIGCRTNPLVNKNCPVGALRCTRKGPYVPPAGTTCVSKVTAPWASLNKPGLVVNT